MIAAAERTDGMVAALAGLAAASLTVLFVYFHWTIAAVAGVAVFCLSVTANEAFLLAIIFLIPVVCLRHIGPISDVGTPLRLLVVAGFFAGRFWRGEAVFSRLTTSHLAKAAIAFLLIAPVTVLAGPIGWGHHSMSQNYQLASWVGFFFFIVCWVDSPKRLEKVLATLLCSLCLVGVFAIVQVAVHGYTQLSLFLAPPGQHFRPWSGRAGSFLGYPNVLAGYLDLALPFAIAAAVLCRGLLRRLGFVALALGVAGLACSQSLGGMITLAFTLCLAIWYFVRSWRVRIALGCGLILLGVGFFAVRHVLNPGHFSVSHMTMPVDVISRFLYFHAAWLLFRNHPIFGIGLGNFVVASPSLVPTAKWMQLGTANLSASNLYLNFLAETGVVGTFALLYLLFVALRMARREVKSPAWRLAPVFGFGALGALCAVLVHGCVDYLFYAPYGTFLYMVLGFLVVTSAMRVRLGPGITPDRESGGTSSCV